MKKALLFVFLLASTSYADVATEIVSKQKASNGDLWICTQYKIDGGEVSSPYPITED